MNYAKLRIVCLTTLIVCIPATGFTCEGYEQYDQALSDEAGEVIVDPVSSDPRQQNRKARQHKRSSIKRGEFESGLYKKFPATFSIYSVLGSDEQWEIYETYKVDADCSFIRDLINHIATK